jgi:hypothetical protein
MHVGARFWRKVHYNAVFEGGKRQEKALNAETQSAQRKDLRKSREENAIQEQAPGRSEGGLPTKNIGTRGACLRSRFSAKAFISTHLHGRSP